MQLYLHPSPFVGFVVEYLLSLVTVLSMREMYEGGVQNHLVYLIEYLRGNLGKASKTIAFRLVARLYVCRLSLDMLAGRRPSDNLIKLWATIAGVN